MPRASLEELLERNRAHVDALGAEHFADVQEGQRPPVVSVCCSDSRVSQEAMFDVTEPGWLFTVSTIGNHVQTVVEGERVLEGSLLYPVQHTGTRTVAIVGHTGCGAVTAAYEAVQGQGSPSASGIAERVGLLEDVVREAIEADRIDLDQPSRAVVDQLVEANVHAQVDLLLDSAQIPEDADVYGFVYDLHGTYGGPRGRAYLVNAGGERDAETLAKRVPDRFGDSVGTLLA